MANNQRRVRIQVDAYTRVCLTVLAGLMTILIVALWADGVNVSDSAGAREVFLDSSAQRNAIIAETKKTNQKLDELISLLRSGSVKVQVLSKDAKQAGGSGDGPSTRKK